MKKIISLVIAISMIFSLSAPAFADDRTWNGLGGDNNWSTANNWGGTAPVYPDAVIFGGSIRLSNTNDIFGGTVTGITFNNTAGAFTLSGNYLNLEGSVTNNDVDTQTIDLALGLCNNEIFNTASGNIIVNGVISGIDPAYGLVKIGNGTLTLSGANTYTGATTVSGGTLTLNRQTGSLSSSTALTFGGTGTFNMDNTGASGALTQSLGALTFSSGDGTVQTTRTAAFNQAITFASLAARTAGAAGNFVNTGTNGTANGFIFTAAPTASQLIDCGFFYNGSGYAAYDATGYVRGLIYGTDTNASAAIGTGATLGVDDITKSVKITGAITAQTTASVNTLNISSNYDFTLAALQTLTVNGILKGGGNSATISGGTGIQAAAGSELVIRTDAAGDALTISTSILANGTNALTKSGAGTLILTGTNTYTGTTTISAGTLQIGSGAATGTLGTGGVTNNSALKFNRTGTLTVGNLISGTGTLEQACATGTTVLSGANTYTGATTVSAGTLQAGVATIASTSGAFGVGSAVDLTNAGTLNLVTFNNTIGSLTGLAGSAVTLGTATLTTGNAADTTFAGIISSGVGGGLTKTGAGTLTLTGTNTYTGITTISAGTLNANSSAALGDHSATNTLIFNGGTLKAGGTITSEATRTVTLTSTGIIDTNGNAVSVAGVISGAGGLTKSGGTGTLTLSADNNYTGTTTISAGILQVGNGSTTGTLSHSGDVINNATLSFNRSNVMEVDNIISGTGALIQAGTGIGTTTLTANNTYTGVTTISSGRLSVATIGDGGVAGNLGQAGVAAANLVFDGGTLRYTAATASTASTNRNFTINAGKTAIMDIYFASTLTISGASTASTGGLTKTGLGTLVLSGTNLYTGITTVSGGILALAGGTAIADTSAVVVNDTLRLDSSERIGSLSGGGMSGVNLQANTLTVGDATNTSYDGVISGLNGKLTKVGAGTLTLSNINTYSGLTSINAGTLAVTDDQAIVGAVTVGNGTDPATLDIGTANLTLAGAYTQSSGSTLKVIVNGVGTSGSISATGASVSNLSSVSVNVTTSAYMPSGTTFTIIDTTGGIAGTAPTGSTSGRLRFTPEISGNDLILTASRAEMGFASAATNANAAAAGNVLDNVTNPSSDMSYVLSIMEDLSNDQVAAALNTMIPEVDAGVINLTTWALDAFVGASFERIGDLLRPTETGVSSGDEAKLNNVWAKGYGSYLNQKMRKGIDGYDAWNAGTAIGADRLFGNVATVGISGGYAYGNVDSNINNAKTTINSGQATIYGGYQDEVYPYYIDAAGTFAWNWYGGKRDIVIGPINRIANSDYDGQQYGLYIGGGCKILLEDILELTPTLSLRWSHLRLAGYTETGADSMDLTVDSQNYDILQSGIGAKLARTMKLDSGVFTPEVHAQWLYDFIGDDMTLTSAFTGGGASFNSNGAKPAQSSFDVGGKLTFAMNNGVSVVGTCDSELRQGFFAIYGSLELLYNF